MKGELGIWLLLAAVFIFIYL